MRLQLITIIFVLSFGVALCSKLLRVPKIYNALITSKEKILPSEAYHGRTGPLFQPIGLPGETILIHPEITGSSKQVLEEFDVKEGDQVKLPNRQGDGKDSKIEQPVTFFPRYSLYYENQPHLILHHPFLYTPLDFSAGVLPRVLESPRTSTNRRQLELEEEKDLSLRTKETSTPSSSGAKEEYVKNNRPSDRNIPDIPPPPPPIRYRGIEEAELVDTLRGLKKDSPN